MNDRPSNPGAAIQLLVRAVDRAAVWPRPALWAAVCTGMLSSIAIDWLTGPHFSMYLLYLFVAGFTAWCLGERPGMAMTVVVALSSTLVRHFQGVAAHPYALGGEAWNALARFVSTGTLVLLASGLRATIALERWRASTDGLTGALNKAAFQERMASRVTEASRTGSVLILCYLDLDGFKAVNDRNGHAAGDHVLRIFAEGARAAMRPDDLFARIGGDEFVALAAVPNMDQADRMAEMIHARLSLLLGETKLGVTCSMGALVHEARGMEQHGNYLELADKLMYEVKRSGKNALRIGRLAPIGVSDGRPRPQRRQLIRRKAA